MLFWSCAVAALAAPLKPARVVVTGGTHGNEYAGVYVVERLELRKRELESTHPSLMIDSLLANPEAHRENRRFIDADLNRQFSASLLGDDTLTGVEPALAKAIAADMGPKGPEASAAVCIDMHTTTANMGCTLIAQAYSPLSVRACAYVYEHWDAECAAECDLDAEYARAGLDEAVTEARQRPIHPLRVLLETGEQETAAHLSSVARDGIEIEVGPTPQGLLRADVVASTERALRLLLRYLELHFSSNAPKPPPTLPVYIDRGKVPFVNARDPASRLPAALVARSLQDRDFEPIREGDALYEHLDGSIVPYDGSFGEVVYPVFINEAAYYYHESGRGIVMSERVDWPIVPPDQERAPSAS